MHRFCISLAWLGAATLVVTPGWTQQREPDNPSARELYFEEMRRYPYDRIPEGARLRALQQLGNVDRAARLKGRRFADSQRWRLIGPRPTNSGVRYETSGRIGAIAMDPRDSKVLYLGAASGGVWKTTDAGETWTPLTDDQPSLATGAIAIDPANPDTVFVGTGEATFSSSSYYGAGILKSTDAGASWRHIPGPWTRVRFGGLVIHPRDSRIMLAGVSSGGIFRSTDSGETWQAVLAPTPTIAGTAVLFDPSDPNIAWAALGSTGGSSSNGIYRSTDAGRTWTLRSGQIGSATGLPSSGVGRISLAIALSNPSILYAAIQSSASSTFGQLLGVYKTTDAGLTWRRLNAANTCNGQCWYNLVLGVQPSNPDVVYFGTVQLQRSLDGGETWRTLGTGPNGQPIHVDHHVFTFTPDGTRLFFGNDGGVWYTDDVDAPQVNFINRNSTLAITQFYGGMSISAADPKIGLAGTQDNSTQLYTGQPVWQTVTCGDGGWTAIDPGVPDFAYTTCQNIDIRRTRSLLTAGFTRVIHGIDTTDRVQFIPPFVMDPSKPNRLYFGTFRLYRSDDAGGLWTPVSDELGQASGTIRSIGIAASDPQVIYVGTNNGRVWLTRNGGANWTLINNGVPNRSVTQIRVDPIDPETAYLTVGGFDSGHVFRTTNGGASWSDISGNLPNTPVTDILLDPDLVDTLYIATDIGVLSSNDGGATWATLGSGLPRVVSFSLVMHRPTRVLRVATHGRSIWEIELPLAGESSRPLISSLEPARSLSGVPGFLLTIRGSGFGAGVRARWNGEDREVVSSSPTELRVRIPASDVAQVGRAAITVLQPTRGGGLSNTVNFSVGDPPVFSSQSIVSAAVPRNRVSPGSIVSLYGANLAPTLSQFVDAPLPTTLGETVVLMNGAAVPLYFVSPGQINFQVPWTVPSGSIRTVEILQDTKRSQTVSLIVDQFAPSLFSANQRGDGQGAMRIAGSAAVPAPENTFPGSRPARNGEVVEVYATGLGPVTNQPASGAAASTTSLSRAMAEVTATAGGVPARVAFAGLAPGTVGLYQVNIEITPELPRGDAVPVEISVGGQRSNTVTMAIR
jgi:uncharacterized protein (TIGR03437 family)